MRIVEFSDTDNTLELLINAAKKKYSIEEYLKFENASPEKHQYYQGIIFDMDLNLVNDDEVETVLSSLKNDLNK